MLHSWLYPWKWMKSTTFAAFVTEANLKRTCINHWYFNHFHQSIFLICLFILLAVKGWVSSSMKFRCNLVDLCHVQIIMLLDMVSYEYGSVMCYRYGRYCTVPLVSVLVQYSAVRVPVRRSDCSWMKKSHFYCTYCSYRYLVPVPYVQHGTGTRTVQYVVNTPEPRTHGTYWYSTVPYVPS